MTHIICLSTIRNTEQPENIPNVTMYYTLKLAFHQLSRSIDVQAIILLYCVYLQRRGVAQPGSAPQWGCGGRRFKSSRPDQKNID
jgi:hypothetical protein